MLHQTRRVVLGALLTLIVFAGPCLGADTWVLWQGVMSFTGQKPDSPEAFVEVERGLDRSACELVKQSKVRGLQTNLSGVVPSVPTEDGVIQNLGGQNWMRRYLCVKTGERPTPLPWKK